MTEYQERLGVEAGQLLRETLAADKNRRKEVEGKGTFLKTGAL